MYSLKFLKAFEYVIKNEGGYVNNPKDPGGATKYGISQRSYPNINIKNLSLENAKEIYYKRWRNGEFERILAENIAIKLFDLSVNVGDKQANIIMQRALRSVGKTVTEDGILGKISLTAINSTSDNLLMVALKSESAGFYRLIARKPNMNGFIVGWLNRAYLTPENR